jgi:hypothetical protein
VIRSTTPPLTSAGWAFGSILRNSLPNGK